jgi:hypothetical protein
MKKAGKKKGSNWIIQGVITRKKLINFNKSKINLIVRIEVLS